MSKSLAHALQQPQELVDGLLTKLEKLSGFTSIDLQFDSDARKLLAEKTAQLGLDPVDTAPDELYWSLMHKFADANTYFENTYFGKTKSVKDRLAVIASLASNCVDTKNNWSIKSAVAKRVLRKNPPKILMKQLGYRSFESMLKHEDPLLVLSVAQQLCSSHWNEVTKNSLSKLSTSDYEEKPLEVVVLENKWLEVTNKLPVVSSNALAGLIVLAPSPQSAQIPVLSLFVVTAQTLESARLASVASRMPELGSAEHSFIASIGGAAITWNSLLFHLSRLHPIDHPEILEPYILSEHLEPASISQRICSLHPLLNFWKDSEYLLKGHGNSQASANIVDVATNFANQAPLGSNTTQAGRSAYWNHLLHRYMQHPAVFDKIITDIEDTLAPGYQSSEQLVPELAEVRNI